MEAPLIIVIIVSVSWIAGCLIYFNYKKHKPLKSVLIPEVINDTKTYNRFLPENKNVKNLTVNIVFDDLPDMVLSQYCDIVIRAKDLINNNIKTLVKNKNESFSENKSDIKKENVTEVKGNVVIKRPRSITEFDFSQNTFLNSVTNRQAPKAKEE
jgi:hypothetical protein